MTETTQDMPPIHVVMLDVSGATIESMEIIDQMIVWICWQRRCDTWVLVWMQSTQKGGGERRRPSADDGVEIENSIACLGQVDDGVAACSRGKD